jgi:hypothetical protein
MDLGKGDHGKTFVQAGPVLRHVDSKWMYINAGQAGNSAQSHMHMNMRQQLKPSWMKCLTPGMHHDHAGQDGRTEALVDGC